MKTRTLPMIRILPAMALTAIAMPAAAQQQMNVTATVPVTSPTGAGSRNLQFGTIAPNGSTQNITVPAAVAPVSGTVQSGEFRYNVAGVRTLTFNVTMPTELASAGATPLVLNSNGAQYGGYCVNNQATCTLTNFNPSTGSNIRICSLTLFGFCLPIVPYGAGNVLRVYVGGQLVVPQSARAGLYTGTVTLTIVQVT